jgi:hypothetical protein
MSLDAGTSLGVVKTLCPLGVSSSKIMKPHINILWTRTHTHRLVKFFRFSILPWTLGFKQWKKQYVTVRHEGTFVVPSEDSAGKEA